MKRPWLTTMMVAALAALIGWTSAPMAATVTSSFNGTNWLYTYTVTPLPGESVSCDGLLHPHRRPDQTART